MKRLLIFLVLSMATPSVIEAQTRTQPRPRPQPRLGFRGYATFGSSVLAATETFEAVADTSRRSTFGGGAQVTNIWRAVFADVGAAQLSLDGERVFVDGRRVFKLGIPLEVRMRTVDVAGGWRLRLMRGRLQPYAGAGLSVLRYEETSEFAGSGEDVNESKTGPLILAGADYAVWRWISAGGELRWRRITGILGEAGASSAFGEDDAGGVSLGFRISIGR